MRIKSEEDLLKSDVRKKIIDEINSTENINRKEKFYKFYQCYKDNTKEYVLRHIRAQFDQDTVNEMAYAITNLGFTRKAVDKLARVYNYGVEREVYVDDKLDEEATEALTKITKECDVNRVFKKTNRWLKRDKNTVQFIAPRKVSFDANDEKYTIKPTVLPAYLYDVVELDDNRELAGCYILSDFSPRHSKNMYYTTGDASIRIRQPDENGNYPYSDGNDNLIADSAKDQENFSKGNYVFWSDKYHFTCNEKGIIVDEDGMPTTEVGLNPIGVKPFVNYAEDQDNSFWAQGGDDLVDGSVSINAMITNIIHIAITQGYGQVVMTGPKLPRAIKLGPNKIVLLEQANTDEPKPEFKFESANPPLDELRQLVEFYVALLLTTNNLSTSGVSTTLNGGGTFPSGIAMMIDKAESMEDIEDQRQIFVDNEPTFWKIFAKWLEVLKSSKELVDDLADITLPVDFDVQVKYGQPTTIISESEKLDIMKKKKDLGLLSKLDMLRMEYPDLTDEQLLKKLQEITEEALQAQVEAQAAMTGEVAAPEGNEESEGIEDEEESSGASAKETSSEEKGEVDKSPSSVKKQNPDAPMLKDVALNGAQITSLVGVINAVATGQLPRDSAIQLIIEGFQMEPEAAERIMGKVGKGFKPEDIAREFERK
jgi:hypothetical protein